MVRTQVYLTEAERRALHAMAQRVDRSQSDLIREAIDLFVEWYRGGNRLALLRQARGIWRGRIDIPALRTLRGEFERSVNQKKISR